MRTSILLLCALSVASFAASGADLVCSESTLSLSSVKLGMKLKGVQSALGQGKLTLRSSDPAAERQTYYQWRVGTATVDVVFDRNDAAVFVGYSARTKASPYTNVTLGVDTIDSIERKLGPPKRKNAPTFGEGEYVFYSIEYGCGPGRSEAIGFASGLTCNRPDMNACLSERVLAARPIDKITLQRAGDRPDQ